MLVKYIDHTADTGFIIHAENLKDLFTVAAKEMFIIICPDDAIKPETKKRLTVSGDTKEELLVNWLSELNYYFETQRILLAKVDTLEIENRTLAASIYVDNIDLERHSIETEIKAVTYHQLYLKKEEGLWKAQVILDL
jgi:SHS2 domain-containing protein